MTRHFIPPPRKATVSAAILIDAARCWREARDNGRRVQPCLARTLAGHDCAMLAPVLDSLIHFYESALGRPIVVGDALTLSEDEHLLLGLVDGLHPHDCLGCTEARTRALDCALCSTRIMLALTLGRPAPTLQ
jgi:hypothetical protein